MKDKPVILIVDDQPQNIELLEAYLIPQGYEIIKAANGEESLGKLSGNSIDLILLDVIMPGMDGFEVTRRVRQDNNNRLLPIILVTVWWEREDRVKGIEAGCDDFISKPVDKIELLARVRSLLKVKAYNDLMSNYRKELEVTKIFADEAREYAESVINAVREPLIALDQDLRVVSVSRSFYEVFKVRPEETVGQLIYDLGNKQWNIPKLRELLETILPQKATFDNYEVEHDFTTIGRRIMLLNARQIKRVLGKKRIILPAIGATTARKRLEDLLTESHEELKELATELKRAARAKSEFLANMSHELRTPLNSINGFSEILYDETFGPLNEKQKIYVSNVLSSGKHLLLLINQILDMAKVEAGKMKLALSSFPMKRILEKISMLVADMASKKKIDMSIDIAGDL